MRSPILTVLIAILAAQPVVAQQPDADALPLGDGRVSDHPLAGSVYACRTTFRAGGARHAGPWFHGDTWNPAEKPHVTGQVLWPDAEFTLSGNETGRRFQGNGLPVQEPTGRFPISPDDPAYQYDTNPNRIAAQHLDFEIPAAPTIDAESHCLPMGMIGFTTTGVALFNALDDAGRDAAAHEIQDSCDGHPQANSQYHYHSGSPCVPGIDSDSLVGWALDGFPILGLRDASGNSLTNADLDACHGQREQVTAGGQTYTYAYHVTREYPYILGCFRGRLSANVLQQVRNGLLPARQRRRR